MTGDGKIIDPENYAAMQVPHESEAAALEAYNAFWHEVYELRKKYRVSNLVVVAAMRSQPRPENLLIGVATAGDSSLGPALAARGLSLLKQKMLDEVDTLAQVSTESSRDS